VRGAWLAGLLLATALAGCGGQADTTSLSQAPASGMRVAGVVESDTLVPLSNATVRLVEANLTLLTHDDGSFGFQAVAPRVYTVEASLAGYRTNVLVARPDTNAASLDFVLQKAVSLAPRQEQFHFRGQLDCSERTLIVRGSCDAGTGVMANQTRYSFVLAVPWNTTVVDLVFPSDATTQPGVGGFRLSVLGNSQDAPLGTEFLYGRFSGHRSFTTRLDPGTSYPDGTRPVDNSTSRFRMEVDPLGACAPDPVGQCADGAGAGTNVQFDLYVTVFYGLPAPPGFTIRTNP